MTPTEAAVARGIFQMYADGFGLKKITKALNADPGLADERERLAAKPDRLPRLRSDLAKIKREIENLLRALEGGRAPDVLVERLAEKEEIANTFVRRSSRSRSSDRQALSFPGVTFGLPHPDPQRLRHPIFPAID